MGSRSKKGTMKSNPDPKKGTAQNNQKGLPVSYG